MIFCILVRLIVWLFRPFGVRFRLLNEDEYLLTYFIMYSVTAKWLRE